MANQNSNDICLICHSEIVNDRTRVLSKGAVKLIEASKTFDDDLWLQWKDLEVVHLHDKCRKAYLSRASSKSALQKVETSRKRAAEVIRVADDDSPSKSNAFDYSRYCFICNEVCSEDRERFRPKSKRRKVCVYSGKTDLLQKIRVAAAVKDDHLGVAVTSRLPKDIDLFERNSVYHKPCVSKFLLR